MTEHAASAQSRQSRSSLRGRQTLTIGAVLIGFIAVVASCLLPPPASQTPEPCDFKGCGANEIRICQDRCVVPRQVGESCDQYIWCPDEEIEVCAAGLTCVNQPDFLAGIKFNFVCAQAKPVGSSCIPDFAPKCPASDPCPSGQYCRAYGGGGGHHGPHAGAGHPAEYYHEKPVDPRVLPFGGKCTDFPTQGEACGIGLCQECEPGLECIDGICRRACATNDDCPCQSQFRMCCNGFCRNVGSTWQALQSAIVDGYGCTSSGCHSGATPSGKLSLETGVAYKNLVGVGGSLDASWLRVSPGAPDKSLLYRLLAAKTLGNPLPGPYPNPMPAGTSKVVHPNLVEAVRLWILAGANENDVVPGLENLIGGCAPFTPTPTPTVTAPIVVPTPTWTPLCTSPPVTGEGARLYAPPWWLDAAEEREICFATYYDLEQEPVPPPTALRKACPTPPNLPPPPPATCVRVDQSHFRQTANYSHHAIIRTYLGATGPNDPSWGIWSCIGGPNEGKSCSSTGGTAQCGDRGACVAARWTCANGTACDPRQPGIAAPAGADCGSAAPCAIAETPACNGYGPSDLHVYGDIIGGSQGATADQTYPDGVYSMVPLKGLIIWNSHAKNIDPMAVRIEQCFDLGFADISDSFQLKGVLDFAGTAKIYVPPFESREYCRAFTFPQNAHVVQIDTHMHKRGQRFRVWAPPNPACGSNGGCEATPQSSMGPTPTPILENLKYDEPTPVAPNFCLDSAVPANRTVLYCAEYYNGPTAQADVKRKSTSPTACTPTNCIEPVGMSCGVSNCEGVPAACDACPVTGGFTTDDEMFILLGSYYEAPCP